MAISFWTPIMDMLPDGGIYDPVDFVPINTQPTATQAVAADTTDIDAQIAAARAERNRIREIANAPGIGPKATAIREANLEKADAALKALQQEKKNLIASGPTTTPTTTTPTTTTPTTTTPTTTTPTTTTPVTSVVTSTPVVTSAVTTTTSQTDKRNAREFLIASLRPYFASASDAGFLKDLEGLIDDYIKQDYDADTISVLLPQTKPYQERFKGNIARATAGLSQLSPAEYIQAEEQYNEVLKRFNLGSLASRDTFANLISGQVSAAELTDRVVNVYDRIRNADPALKSELDRVKELSAGQLSEADFAKALLTGETGANELKRKITTAEISAEARTRGLETTRAQQLEQLGVTREQARAGFEQIGLTQPRLTQLEEIYTKTTPDASGLQEELEREQFQGMQSQRRRRLAEQEQAAFMGQAGVSGISLGRRRTGSI